MTKDYVSKYELLKNENIGVYVEEAELKAGEIAIDEYDEVYTEGTVEDCIVIPSMDVFKGFYFVAAWKDSNAYDYYTKDREEAISLADSFIYMDEYDEAYAYDFEENPIYENGFEEGDEFDRIRIDLNMGRTKDTLMFIEKNTMRYDDFMAETECYDDRDCFIDDKPGDYKDIVNRDSCIIDLGRRSYLVDGKEIWFI